MLDKASTRLTFNISLLAKPTHAKCASE